MSIYKIINVGANKRLNIYRDGMTPLYNHQNITVWEKTGSEDQSWYIDNLGNGVYIKSVVDSNFGLNVYRVGDPYNCDLFPIVGNETDACVNIIPCGGRYRIQLANYPNLYLTAGGDVNGSNVYWSELVEGSQYQVWGFYEIEPLSCPLDSYSHISQPFGVEGHRGIDYSAVAGTPVKAAGDGTVIYIHDWDGTLNNLETMGNAIYIRHNDGMAMYMHLNESASTFVDLGDTVEKGDLIGRVGLTGNTDGAHLHFEYKVGTSFPENDINAYYSGYLVDPSKYIE